MYSFGRRPTGVKHDKLTETQVDFHALLSEAPGSLRGLQGLKDLQVSGSPPPSSSRPSAQPQAQTHAEEQELRSWTGPEGSKLRQIQADTVFVTLGTTRAQAGSMPAFEVIDRGYAVAAAAAAFSPEKLSSGTGQRLLYCSSGAGNSQSLFPYLRSKGQTDEAMTALPYTDVTIVQPGVLLEAKREQPRYLEAAAQVVSKWLACASDNVGASVHDVGAAMAELGTRPIDQWRKASALAGKEPSGTGFESAQSTALGLWKSCGGREAHTLSRATVRNPEILKVARSLAQGKQA